MNPGQALDVLVAEQVMGWRWTNGAIPAFLIPITPGDFRTYTTRDWADFRPSTDISAAWLVVEKLKVKYLVTIRTTHIGPKGATFNSTNHVQISGAGVSEEAKGETIPHGICLAALAAVGALPK